MIPRPFRGWYNPRSAPAKPLSTQPKDDYETIMYAGCVHGGTRDFVDRLTKKITEHRPDVFIFTGDLAGTEIMERLKRAFYNFVQKPANEHLAATPPLSDDELLDKPIIGRESGEPKTLREGYKALRRLQLEPEECRPDHVASQPESLSDRDIVKRIKDLGTNYFGKWAHDNLCSEARNELLRELGPCARRLLVPIQQMRERGTTVAVVEGNWDDLKTGGIGTIAGNDIEAFDTKSFFAKKGIPFVDQLTVLETATTLQILVPYRTALDYHSVPEAEKAATRILGRKAVTEGKPVIMVSHAEVTPDLHNLPFAKWKPSNNESRIKCNLHDAITTFKPAEVVYSHQHGPIRDETDWRIDPNAKHVLGPSEDGGVELITDSHLIGPHPEQVIVTYIPLYGLAVLRVPRKGSREIFDGSRQPITILSGA